MLKKFAIQLLNDIATECENRAIVNFEEDNCELLLRAASEITESIDVISELKIDSNK
jgi:hypothetical protein